MAYIYNKEPFEEAKNLYLESRILKSVSFSLVKYMKSGFLYVKPRVRFTDGHVEEYPISRVKEGWTITLTFPVEEKE